MAKLSPQSAPAGETQDGSGAAVGASAPGSLGPLPALSLSKGPLGSLPRPQRARERYEPDMELRKHFIGERLEKQLAVGKGRLDAIQAAIPAGDNGSARELKSRIKALQSWHNKGRSLVPVMKTFLKLT